MTHVTIIWRDQSRETLKCEVESCLPENGFLCVELRGDMLQPGVEHKTLMFPTDQIYSVTIEELSEREQRGYREDSTFREMPDKSRWFGGMGNTGGGSESL